MITIRDVAERAGVSVATVSRVLNNNGKVSRKTREKVIRAMKELGYSPRPWARYLAVPKRSLKVGIVVTDRIRKHMKKGSFYHDVYHGILEVAKQCKVEIELINAGKKLKTDGYLLIGADFDAEMIGFYKSQGIPVVLVDHYIPGLKIDAVVSDGYGGAVSAVSMLVETGHKRIVHIHNPLMAYSFRERYDGYFAVMERYNLFPKTYEFDDLNDNMAAVVELMLSTYGLPDAIFTSNDFAAVRAYYELQKRGVRIPDDVSLVGFDDSTESENLGITSVRVFKEELGSFSMRRLITLITGQDVHPAKISLFTELVMRSSVKKRKGG
jgi:LacI family transcriptional regulator